MKTKPPPPYIGVTGFSWAADVYEALTLYHSRPPQETPRRKLMVGVLLKSDFGRSVRHPSRYPPPETISSLFAPSALALNLVHLCAAGLPDAELLGRVYALAGPNCDGFQFNGARPRRGDLMRLHDLAAEDGRQLRVVLQVRLREGFGVPSPAHYLDLVSDLLFDASGGEGVPLDVDETMIALRHARELWGPSVGLSVAGGLSGKTLRSVLPPLLEEFPDLSFHAKTGVRDAEDELDLVGALPEYLSTARELTR